MPQMILQQYNEEKYSRKFIDIKIRGEILANPELEERIKWGTKLVEDFIDTAVNDGFYKEKNARVIQLVGMDIEALVLDIFVGVAYCQLPELFTSVTSMAASRLGFDDKLDAIKTVAELLAVLCETDVFDINKASRSDSLVVQSKIPLSDLLLDFIEHSTYLPPMVCEPSKLTSNYSSGYLTNSDSVVLGAGNHHDGDMCLDLLNVINSIPLTLDTEFLCKVEEEPKNKLETRDQEVQWMRFKKQSYRFYSMITSQGNKFYLTNKPDKRGRLYAQGYHISTAGTAFKKASIELWDAELVTGVFK